jgi:hypothetical protein
MKRVQKVAFGLPVLMLLAGCVSVPDGPMVAAYPGEGKSLEAFDKDDHACQDYAYDKVAGQVNRANDRQARNGILGAIIGTGLGAAVGNTKGAIVGGTAGALVGSSTAQPGFQQYSAQRRYDIAYSECMESKGDRVGEPRHHYRDRDQDEDGPPPPPPRDDHY